MHAKCFYGVLCPLPHQQLVFPIFNMGSPLDLPTHEVCYVFCVQVLRATYLYVPCHKHYFRAVRAVLVIAERISARHWIADCGPGIGSCMFVCLYICPSHFWNAIKARGIRDCNSVPQLCMHLCIDSPPCVRASACMHALQLIYQYLDYNTSKMSPATERTRWL